MNLSEANELYKQIKRVEKKRKEKRRRKRKREKKKREKKDDAHNIAIKHKIK